MSRRPRAAYYERVSTDEQSEKDTIRSQDKALHKAYDKHFADDADEPWEFAGTFKDEGVSGTLPFEDRFQGSRMMQMIRRSEIDIVCVTRSDRLARDRTIANNIADEFGGRDILIQSPNEHIDLSTPAGRLHFAIMCDFSHYEREIIRDRTMAGRETHALNGEFINGPIPFGYDIENDRLVPSARMVIQLLMTEAELVVEIYERCAAGESLLSIMRWLRAAGVPSIRRYYNKKKGRFYEEVRPLWQHSRLMDIVQSTTYYGERVLKFHKAGSSKFKKIPAHITQTVPALVTRELWNRAKDARERHISNFETVRRSDDYVYLLTGKLVCGSCGFKMIGNFKKPDKYHNNPKMYYSCSRGKGRYGYRDACSKPLYVNGLKIEELVLERIDEIVANPAAVLSSIRAQQVARHGDVNRHDAEKKAIRQKLAGLERGRAVLVELVSTGQLTAKEFRAQTSSNASQAADVRHTLELLENEESLAEALLGQLRDAEQLLGVLQEQWPIARAADHPRAALREFLKPLIQRIVLNPDKTVEGTILFDARSTDSAQLCDYTSVGRPGVQLFATLLAAD